MARRRGNNNSTGSCIIYMFMIGFITSVAGAIASFIAKNGTIVIFIFIAIFAIMFYIAKKHEKMQKELLEEQRLYEQTKREWYKKQEIRRELLKEILDELHLENLSLLSREYDDQVSINSVLTSDNYTEYTYLIETNAFESIRKVLEEKRGIVDSINSFLKENSYKRSRKVIKGLNITESQVELVKDILNELHLENLDLLLKEYDDQIIVRSAQSLNNYSDYKYIRDYNALGIIRITLEEKRAIVDSINSFLKENSYKSKPQYDQVEKQLVAYANTPIVYNVKVVYITSAGNERDSIDLNITESRISEVIEHPELLMTKGEYNKILKQQAKAELDAKKHAYYARVNDIINFANNSKRIMIVKSATKTLDKLIQELFEKTVNSVQKVKTIDSDEWWLLDSFISTKDDQIKKIVQDDKQISDYYSSEDFALLKDTCNLLTESQKEFNEYIEEKAESITKLFGTRVVRNETQNEYVYNYVRAYKKSVTPFTAEVSDFVFGSAERDPIEYIVKCFYPNKSRYKEQIQNLKILMEELETLNEAKVIIDNYKKDYDEYIQNVPEFVMEKDEDGFYSRLGLTIIDEAVLNVEYKFTYTSNGGLVQRSFTVPMNEETITELINRLESKLSLEALAKEQRALVTSKLRAYIKERDNYTCCNCGNSIYNEPNLLLEIDHINPISNGGLTTEDNLQTLCWKCNRIKGAKVNYPY